MCACSPTNVLAAYCGRRFRGPDGKPVACVHPETGKAHPAPPPAPVALGDHAPATAAHFGAHPSHLHEGSTKHVHHAIVTQCTASAELARRQAAVDYSRGNTAAAAHMLALAERSDAAAQHVAAGRLDEARAHIASSAHLLMNQPARPGGLHPGKSLAHPGEIV